MRGLDFVRQAVCLILGVVLLGGVAPGMSTVVAEEAPVIECGGRAQHDRIHVFEDHGPDGFTWTNPATGEDEHRPESGVVAGDGSAGDPFVISGWCIQPVVAALGPGIHIENTSSHVVVRDNAVIGPGELFDEAAVRIESVENIVLEENLVARAQYGIGTWFSDGIMIRENIALENHGFGLLVGQNENGVVAQNLVMDNDNGISFVLAPGLLVEGNTLHDNRVGVTNGLSDDAVIQDNDIARNVDGIYIREAANVMVRRNLVIDSSGGGVAFDLSPLGTVEDNQVIDSGNEGVIFWGSPEGTAIGNTATGNGFSTDRHGIRFAGSPQSVATGNILTGNFDGFALDGSPDSLLQHNIVTDNEEAGIILWGSPGVAVEDNRITLNKRGVWVVDDAQDVVLQGNDIAENTGGLGVDAAQANDLVLATGNWWGCPGGPIHAACDGVSGDVDASSWLSEPSPDAPQAPQWVDVDAQQVDAGESLTFTVTATDDGGETITLSVLGAPHGAQFTQTVDDPGVAQGDFSWTPLFHQTGTATVTFVASTGVLQSVMSVTITVHDADPPEADIRLGVVSPAPSAVSPNETVVLIASVRNLGDGAVTVPLNLSSSAGWDVTTPAQSLQLGPGEMVHVPVEVVVGEGSLFSRVTLKAEVQGVPEINRQVTWILEVPVYNEVEMFETTTGSEITGEVFVHYADGSPVVGAPVTGVRSNGWDMTGVMQDSFGGATNETGRLGFSFSPTDLAAQLTGTHTITTSAQVDGKEFRGFISYQVGV